MPLQEIDTLFVRFVERFVGRRKEFPRVYFERSKEAGPAVRNRAGSEPLLGRASTASSPSAPPFTPSTPAVDSPGWHSGSYGRRESRRGSHPPPRHGGQCRLGRHAHTPCTRDSPHRPAGPGQRGVRQRPAVGGRSYHRGGASRHARRGPSPHGSVLGAGSDGRHPHRQRDRGDLHAALGWPPFGRTKPKTSSRRSLHRGCPPCRGHRSSHRLSDADRFFSPNLVEHQTMP